MAMIWIVAFLLIFLPSVSSAAVSLSEKDWQTLKAIARGGGGAGGSVSSGSGLPATCTPGTGPNALYLDTDTGSLYYCSTANTFTSLGTSEQDTLDSTFDRGKVIDGANSLPNAVRIGDGTTSICLYTDATLGPVIKPCTDADTRTHIWTNFTWGLRDHEGDADMFIVDPDATDNARYAWQSGYRPIKTIPLLADMLYPRGSSTLVTDTALISGGQVDPYLTTTDSDSDGFYRKFRMPPDWDGGTVTATITVINTNATPANAFRVDVSGECWPAGTAVGTTISTTGEQSAIITFGSSGSCGGSACNQNDPASATTAAITINGTPAGGNYCGFQAQTNATGTTETVGGIKIVQMDIHYKINKGF